MKNRVRAVCSMVLVMALVVCLCELARPSWSELERSLKDDIVGGTTCYVDGTQVCPAPNPACWMRWGPSCPKVWNPLDPLYGKHKCIVPTGDSVNDPYPPQAKLVSAPGANGITTDPAYTCALRMTCGPQCTWDPLWTEWFCDFAIPIVATAINVVKTEPDPIGTGYCTAAEE
jgi:hypothetical protein